ncbi:release factor glutamine methyltransferase-like isoform X2 [Rosa chinensis]|uniref:release factor glutamine methyltransferase-like isoform X2 n=1 Tax=Rosa chinensis TaxID=74649 RepID=UPI001AD91EF2|nr:release factor glutamine methyltransferase-like isoform X2 [Rosa chinensis]
MGRALEDTGLFMQWVSIPRPDTELIFYLVGDVVKDEEGFREGLWADLGIGSGTIAIGIGRVLGTGVRVIATDLSLTAIRLRVLMWRGRYGLQHVFEPWRGSNCCSGSYQYNRYEGI